MVGDGGRTLLVRGRIYTGDWQGEAMTDALWAEDGIVRAIGAEALAVGERRAGERLDLGPGECAVPGFWDSHIHLADYGLSLDEVALGDLTSGEAVARRLEEALSARGGGDAPLLGRGWMVGRWQGPPPHRSQLAALGERPVLLWNHDYHSVWVNDTALRLAGVGAATPDPPGGRIERDVDGVPTGVLRDAAVDLVAHLWPEADDERLERAIDRAQDALLALGVTAVCTMHEGPTAVRALVRLHRAGRLRLRVAVYPAEAEVGALAAVGIGSGLGDDRLWLGGVKAFMDGALGSQTAWMRAPYLEVGGTGLAMPFAAELAERVARLRAAGLRLALHAIGDRAVAEAVSALGEGMPAAGVDRIEHAQLVSPDVWQRWPAGRVVASVQPVHLTDDLELMARFWGPERAAHAFPLRSLLARGVALLFGSDAPVSDPDPLKGLWAAVERRRPGGEPWQAAEALTPAEALAAYGAVPARVEDRPRLGRLLPASPLDLVVLNADPLASGTDLGALRVVHVERGA